MDTPQKVVLTHHTSSDLYCGVNDNQYVNIIGAEALNSVVGFGINSGDIWLENVQCFGSEVSLIDCSFTASVSPNCTHQQDIGIRCQPLQGIVCGRNLSLG